MRIGCRNAQRQSGLLDLHDVAVLQFDFVAETERVRAERINVRAAGPSMRRLFEVTDFECCDWTSRIMAQLELLKSVAISPDKFLGDIVFILTRCN